MIRKPGAMLPLAMTMVGVFVGVLLMNPSGAMAQPKGASGEGVSYNVNSSILDNLKSLVGKKVEVVLTSGKTFTGIVKEVGTHLVHLEKLEGKEYFDALIVIENISALDSRFRGEQR